MWAVIDTSVYTGHWERGLYAERLDEVRKAFVVRHSAVVLSELRRGARTPDWWEAGRIIQAVSDAQDWDGNKRRDFQNDALIALTARGHGATVVTANRQDFGILGRRLGVAVLIV